MHVPLDTGNKEKKKKHCPCLPDGHLFTNPILSALHFQGPKSNIYVCVCLVHTFKEQSFQNRSLVSRGKRMGDAKPLAMSF